MTESSSAIEGLLKRNLFDVFGQHDQSKRRAAIAELFTEDVVFSDPHSRHVGHDALDAAVEALQGRLPDFVFNEIGPAQTLTDAGRQAWSFGPANDPKRVTGLDVIVVRGGRIAALYTFLDPPLT